MEHFHGVYNYYGDDSDYSASSDEGESWLTILQRIKENDRYAQELDTDSYDYNSIDNMTDEGWEELGRDISNNTHLETVSLHEGALDNHKMRCFFRGLMKSSSINEFHLHDNELSISVVRSMVPFLQNADNLTYLDLDGNGIQTKGFNMLFRALRNRPIEKLHCDGCGIESIDIDSEHMPHNFEFLHLSGNGISTDGCRGLAKLLQGDNSTLRELWLSENEIDDEGVEILVDALQNNTSLETLNLRDNEISVEGMKACLRLVNDISSINATLQTNHTLTSLHVKEIPYVSLGINDEIQNHIDIHSEFLAGL
ncbi:leucine-rich repeat protein [Skeletonema marinoi]|uniref:Leucine-rich repeat protein n=1 Tax=Skeletonema marinoi TaxID=267567 RepID=A0AAD9DHC4_9STRA|nr:leucine-rich repeat protein [Skeletonema marinoi]